MERETRPGLSTAQLDAIGAAFLRKHGARSAPQLSYGFPGFTWISVNEQMVLAVEPIICARAAHVVEEADGWTLRTHNGSLAAHYEHTVVIGDGEPHVLTRLPAA